MSLSYFVRVIKQPRYHSVPVRRHVSHHAVFPSPAMRRVLAGRRVDHAAGSASGGTRQRSCVNRLRTAGRKRLHVVQVRTRARVSSAVASPRSASSLRFPSFSYCQTVGVQAHKPRFKLKLNVSFLEKKFAGVQSSAERGGAGEANEESALRGKGSAG